MQPIQNISAEGPKGWSVGGWTGKGAEEKRRKVHEQGRIAAMGSNEVAMSSSHRC